MVGPPLPSVPAPPGYLGTPAQPKLGIPPGGMPPPRIAAKNSLASFSFNMKSTVEDEKLKDKISEEDKKTISDKCEEVIFYIQYYELCQAQHADNGKLNKCRLKASENSILLDTS
jgi:hypothetical protein